MKCIKYAVLAVLLFSLSSCFMTFKYNTKHQFDDAEIDLKTVQFYNQNTIVLRRALKSSEIKTNTSGSVTFENGKYYREIVIYSKTPCLVEKIDTEKEIIYVRFEKGDNKLLPFKLNEGKYMLDYLPWTFDNSVGKLTYGGDEYLLQQGFPVFLLIDSSEKVVEKTKRKVLKGVRVQ